MPGDRIVVFRKPVNQQIHHLKFPIATLEKVPETATELPQRAEEQSTGVIKSARLDGSDCCGS